MTEQQILSFLYVADRLNFTKAAEELYVTVPTVTHHIKTLEEELGVTLFFRTSRIVRLTEAGKSFYLDAREIMRQFEFAKKHLAMLSHKKPLLLRIGLTTDANWEKLVPALRAVRQEYQNLAPHIITAEYFTLKQLFANKQLDAVIASKDQLADTDGTFRPLHRMPPCVLFPKGHRFDGRETVAFEELEGERLICLDTRCMPFNADSVLQKKLAAYTQNHISSPCESGQEAAALVQSGFGVAVLPAFYIPPAEGLAAVPLDGIPPLEYGCLYRGKEEHIRYFAEHLNSSVSPLPAP